MTSQECKRLRAGMIVLIYWPSTADGTNLKKAKVHRVNKAGTKVAGVFALRRNPSYKAAEYGNAFRWFGAEEIEGMQR